MNFMPDEDESRFQVDVRLPVGSSLAATQSLLDRIARDVRDNLPGVPARSGNAGLGGGGGGGNNAGSIFVRLKPIDERDVSQQELMLQARKLVQPYPARPRHLGAGHRRPAASPAAAARRFSTRSSDRTWRSSTNTPPRRSTLMEKSPALVDVDRSFQPGLPELRLDIDRKRAADLGVRVQDVSQTVNALVAGQEVTTFNAASDQYDVVLKAQDSFRRTPESMASATVRTASRRARAAAQPRDVRRGLGTGVRSTGSTGSGRSPISANPAPGISQAEGQAALEAAFAALDMEPGYNARDERPVARARPRRLLLRASRSRCRSSSCTWCWRRSSSRSSTRSRSC